jgi:iron complex outermembrane recepter protein
MGRRWTVAALPIAMLAGVNAPYGCARAASDSLEEIVVTAQKRDQREQDVPITISVITGAAFAASDIKDLLQAANYVPGMVFSRAPDDGLALSFRGVGTPARTQAFDQSIALFVDGLFIAKGRLYTQPIFDVAQIEFTKGTESAVLGKNASVGAISVLSREPGSELSGELRATAELQHGGGILDGALDIPLGETAAIRVAAHHNDTDGWVRNTATGREVPIDRDTGVRLTGVWRPTDGFDAKLIYQHNDDLRIGVPYQIVEANLPAEFGEGVFDDRESELTNSNPNRETTHVTHSDFVNLKMTWALGDMHLVSQTGYVQYGLDFKDDFDFSNQPWIDFLRNERYTQESEEIRLVSASGARSEFLAGLFFFHSQWHSVELQQWDVPGYPPETPIAGQLFNGPFTDDFSQTTNNQSVFGQWTWRGFDPWRSTLGLRAVHESKDVLYGRTNEAPLTIWNTVANPPFALTPLSFADTFVDGDASLEWHHSKSLLAYVAYGHGTKTGGFAETDSVLSANPEDTRVQTETTNAVEAGVKTLWHDGAVKLNAALFDMQIKNFQSTTFTGAAFVTENTPLRSKGVDVDSEWQVNRLLHLGAAMTYSDAVEIPTQVDRDAGVTCNPCQATAAPKWNGVAQMNFRDTLNAAFDWTADFHIRYRSVMFNQLGEMFRTNSFTPIDIGIGAAARDDRYGGQLLGKNIFNRLTQDFSSPSVAPYFTSLASPAPLRTVNLSLWGRF